MNRSVVIHHNTAWWRSQFATSRCTSGSARRQRSGRGGKRVARATPFGMLVAFSKLLPDQKTQRQHHCHGMAVKARPKTALILIPAQFFFGFLMELLNGMATMGILNQFLQRRRGGQVAPIELVFFGLPLSRPLSQQPADVCLTCCRQTPGSQRQSIHAKRDTQLSIAYSEELIFSMSVTLQSTDRHHGIVG